MSRAETDGIDFEDSSGNVFADIGFDASAASSLLHKAELVGVLHRYCGEMGLSQSAFGKLVGIPQPRLSKLFAGKVAEISTDRLIEAIAKLGGHITIRIETHPEAARAGRVETEFA